MSETIPKPKTVRDVLNVIETFMMERAYGDEQIDHLWNILTGLRGPDNDSKDLKMKTTACLRYMALGRAPTRVGALVSEDDPVYDRFDRNNYIENSGHFMMHIEAAHNALKSIDPRPRLINLREVKLDE